MEIKFKRDTSFRKQFFVPDSFAHPAKMDAQLLIWIVEHYSGAGETILDPMAGSGTTMLACTLGRNVVLVELEEKFCKMMWDNWEQVKMRPQLGSTMGSCQIIQGDARQLEGLLVDKIITSPPYEEAMGKKHHSPKADKMAGEKSLPQSYTGKVDKIITSPPFSEAKFDKRHGLKDLTSKEMKGRKAWANREDNNPTNPDNIANLPYGEIDKCIFSPPYAEQPDPSRTNHGILNHSDDCKCNFCRKNRGNKGAIQGYRQVDKIVTSPPYEGTTGEGKEIGSEGHAVGAFHYGEDSRQIGNLKSQSYLEAMLQVYQQCYKVLVPKGLMILVTKNFIRNKQVVRLDEDTIKLCEQAGFNFVERHYRELPSQSFWRVIYHQKFPDVEQIKNEDVLVFSSVGGKG